MAKFIEWRAPPSGVVGSPAVQEEEWEWIFRSLASIWARTSAVSSASTRPAQSSYGRRAKRQTLIALAAKLPPCVVAMEACCGAPHLGRVFAGHGHDVGLTSPESVRPYVKAQKNDDRDVERIAEAATRPTMRFVGPVAARHADASLA